MLSNKNKKTFTALGFSILSVFWTTVHADLLNGPAADIRAGGAEASCGINTPDPISDEGPQTASCSFPDGTFKASADLPKGEVKAYATTPGDSPDPDEEQAAYGVFSDLITVTDGWDENGEVSGTLELEIHGTVDVSNSINESDADFDVLIWYPSEPTPPCLVDVDDCGILAGPYDYAGVDFDLFANQLLDDTALSTGTGYSFIHSGTGPDLHATLTIPWTVTQANPSFYIAFVAKAEVITGSPGTADFFNTAKANLRGPIGMQYTAKNGFGQNLASLPPVVDGPVTVNGNVQTEEELPVCAMVLASGQYLFSCDPTSQYALNDLPRETNGTVTRQIYADGFFPVVKSLPGSTTETVVMTPSSNCPSYNFPSSPDVNPASAGVRKSISGRVLVGETEIPICAMVLANGSYMFSCDGSGSYSLELPLDANGQFQLQVYADGFAPVVQTFDESDTGGDVRMARSTECQGASL